MSWHAILLALSGTDPRHGVHMAFTRCLKHYLQYIEGESCPVCAMQTLQQRFDEEHKKTVARVDAQDERLATLEAALKTIEGHVLTAVNKLGDNLATPPPSTGGKKA